MRRIEEARNGAGEDGGIFSLQPADTSICRLFRLEVALSMPKAVLMDKPAMGDDTPANVLV